jgi:hypothetical protein
LRSVFASLAQLPYFKTRTYFYVTKEARQRVPVDPVVPVADVVVPPLPSTFPLEVVAVFVTGGPLPVSVAVVPDVPDVPVVAGWSVSVDPAVLSFGARLHETQSGMMARIAMTPRMRI